MRFYIVLGLLCLCLWQTNAHRWRMGKCPSVKPMAFFDRKQIVGPWYVQRALSETKPCMMLNYTIPKNLEEGVLAVEEKDARGYGRVSTGNMFGTEKLGFYTIKFSTNRITARYGFVYTDYENIALVFHCQQFVFFHRINVFALSRQPKFDTQLFNNNAWRLSQYGLDPYSLVPVWKRMCPTPMRDGDEGEMYEEMKTLRGRH